MAVERTIPEPMEPTEENQPARKQGESRRSFLAKLGLGAIALGLTVGSLGGLRRNRGGRPAAAASGGFPGEDSIFHPARDPRTDPRRHRY